MDSLYPINRVEHLFAGLHDDLPANSLLAAFTNAAIEFTETHAESDADADAEAEPTPNESPFVRLLMLAVREAHHEGAKSVVFEPRQDAVAVHFNYPHGRSVERDSPPKRIMGSILGAVRSLAGDSAEISLAGKRVAVAFFETPYGRGVSLVILGDLPSAP